MKKILFYLILFALSAEVSANSTKDTIQKVVLSKDKTMIWVVNSKRARAVSVLEKTIPYINDSLANISVRNGTASIKDSIYNDPWWTTLFGNEIHQKRELWILGDYACVFPTNEEILQAKNKKELLTFCFLAIISAVFFSFFLYSEGRSMTKLVFIFTTFILVFVLLRNNNLTNYDKMLLGLISTIPGFIITFFSFPHWERRRKIEDEGWIEENKNLNDKKNIKIYSRKKDSSFEKEIIFLDKKYRMLKKSTTIQEEILI